MTIKAAFVDVDGTAVNTELRNRRAIESVASIGGHNIEQEDWNSLGGQGDGDIWGMISKETPDLMKIFNSAASFELACLNAKLMRVDEIKKISETEEAIQLFKASNIGVAAVSNSITGDVEASLKAAGYSLEKTFNFCLFRDVLREKGLRSKPHSDPYLHARDMMDGILKENAGKNHTPLQHSECLVLEDSKTGVRSGLSAGMNVIHLIDESGSLDSNEVKQTLARHQGATYSPVPLSQLVKKCKQALAL